MAIEAAELISGNRNAENDVKNNVETAELIRGDGNAKDDAKNAMEAAELTRGNRDTVEAVEDKIKTVKAVSPTTQTPSGPYHGEYFYQDRYHLATGTINQNVWKFFQTRVNLAKPKFMLGPIEKKMAIGANMPNIQL